MKKRLVILFATALCLLAPVSTRSVWAADPGSRYADAFVLIEQGQAAEEKSDLATAYRSYQSALSALHSIRTDSPDWNSQMVEYRLKDCQTRFDAIKAKLPEPPPAPATANVPVASAVTPPVPVPVATPAPVATPPAPTPAPAVKSVTADQSAKLKTQIDKLEAENHQLKSDLTEAKRAAAAEKKAAAVKVAPSPVPVDSGETKRLRNELADAHTEIDRLKKAAGSSTVVASPAVAAPPADSAEMKKLRAELNKTRAEADAAKKSAAQVPDLEKQNKDLNAKLAVADKKASTPTVDPAELKKTRADLDAARADAAAQTKKNAAQLADLQKQNKDLSAQLASAEKKSNIAPADSPEVKNLRAELDRSHAEVADLKKQVAAKPGVAPVPVADSSEVKTLRAQLADTHKQLDQANKSASQVADLQKQNKDLSAKLADADKKAAAAAARPVPVDNSAELKKLREELDTARAEADKGKKASARVNELEKENKDLSAKLTAEKKTEAEAPTVAPDVRVMKQLRTENSYLRNLLDTYAEQNSELKGQLRRHDQNQAKTAQ